MNKQIKEELSKEREIMLGKVREALKDFTDKTGILVPSLRWEVSVVTKLGTSDLYAEYYDFDAELKT